MKPPRTFGIRIRTRRTAANQGADAPRFTTPPTYTLHPEKPLPHRLNATYQPLSLSPRGASLRHPSPVDPQLYQPLQ
ncbi:hypothetical protein BHM03_00015019 [Ensete ventricosum]|nr:hypothetical protein BHM03_00015019 [Ensete ventricosum]